METTSILGWFSLFGQSDFVDDSYPNTPKCILSTESLCTSIKSYWQRITFYKAIHATHFFASKVASQ